eukprot:TRINITY_DN25923_c0_g1_i3.p1 TRINITY_DN25923_c0_g1~~TRINITY_DN25923_c0_g1_i3.p1  ORF type:complete len:424 (-),score=215.41 TRINITY_DN25923_c0_g1_i3:29-1300(-)
MLASKVSSISKVVNPRVKTHGVRKISHNQGLQEVVIVSGVRTPIAQFGGSLSSLTAPQLGSIVIKEALARGKVDPKHVKEVIMGNVLSANVGQAPARQAALGAGLSEEVSCTTINKVCSSGMKSIMFGAQSIMLGHNDVIVAGGFESMSNTPYYMDKARFSGYRYGHGQLIDGVLKDGLWDVYNNIHMGNCAENTAKKMGITRQEQDQHAIESYKRAAAAYKSGVFKAEIVPVTVASKKGDTVVEEDEEYKLIKEDKIATLKAAFTKDGTVTAANSSKLNDGGAAVVIMSAARARELGLKPLAKILGFADAEHAPIDFPTAPAKAVPKALARAGISAKDVDLYELNQAFSVVSIANARLLNIDPAKVDVFGGAVALGHPIGASGARIVVTLLNALKHHNKRIGVAGICNGGGGASSVVVERLD